MEDIMQAIGAIAKTAGEIGMTRDDLSKAKDLLQKHGDERDRLFDAMLSLLGKPSADGVIDEWKSTCEKASELLDGLNSSIPPSPSGERLTGIGAGDFYEGEKKVWAENGKGQIALVSEVLVKVKVVNTGLIQQFNDDLKSIRDSNAEGQSTLNENLDAIKAELLDLANTLASKVGDKTLTAWMKDGSAKEYIKKWRDDVAQKSESNFTVAQQNGQLKKQILDKIEALKNAREQLDEKWIEEMYRSGEECTKSLPSLGETGDYRALDWVRFGEECLEPLGESRDVATEQSKTLFDEVLPGLQGEIDARYAALTDDPSEISDWKSELQERQEAIQEALATEDEVIKNLAEGPYQEAARDTFDGVRSTFTEGMKDLLDKTKDAEDQLKV
jgi:hypothetical protein